MRILVIQHDADKGLGLFTPPLASHELDIQFAGHGEIGLSGHGAVIALPGVANPDDATDAVDATREVLREALSQGLPILGICLGAELLAEAAGGVTGRCRPEWGYREVSLTASGRDDHLLGDLPAQFAVFQAHDYGFDLPPNAVALAHRPQRCRHFASATTRGACSSTPSRRWRCSTAGRGALGHVMEANGVDPEATRQLGRRYVPEWAGHAAGMGAALRRRGRRGLDGCGEASQKADRLDVVVQQVLEHDPVDAGVPVLAHPGERLVERTRHAESGELLEQGVRIRAAPLGKSPGAAAEIGGVTAGDPRHHDRERHRRRIAARVAPRRLDDRASLGALGGSRVDRVVLVGEPSGEARRARLGAAADDHGRVRALHRLRLGVEATRR